MSEGKISNWKIGFPTSFPSMAAELLSLKPNVLLAAGVLSSQGAEVHFINMAPRSGPGNRTWHSAVRRADLSNPQRQGIAWVMARSSEIGHGQAAPSETASLCRASTLPRSDR